MGGAEFREAWLDCHESHKISHRRKILLLGMAVAVIVFVVGSLLAWR
jgi:hypothetical protein